MAGKSHWLVKSEPDCFSIQDLAASPRKTTCWSGVRNYQARNFMRDGMQLGDPVLFYHSSCEPTAIVGVAEVTRTAYPDPTAWDPRDDHYDPAASPENPRWQMVDLRLQEIFPRPVVLEELRPIKGLAGMELLKRGSRLSVQPVSAAEFAIVLRLAHAAGPAKSAARKPAGRSAAKR